MLSSLIWDAMDKMLDREDPIFNILRQQYRVAEISDLELTGTGFYANFDVPQPVPLLSPTASFQIGDLYGEIKEVQAGVGFLLFVTSEKLDFLEGYTYGDEHWPENISSYSLFFAEGKAEI